MVNLKVEGMSCTNCQAAVEKALMEVPGVTDVDVALDEGTVAVKGDTAPEALIKAVQDAGYSAQLAGASS